MLDYQINESISRAYSESVCGYKCHRNKNSEKNRVNEDNNVVYRVQGPSTIELDRARELQRRNSLTPEERAREDIQRARLQRERRQREHEYANRSKTFISASPERPRRPEATIGPANSRSATEMRAAMATDPGMRIGQGVYDGLGLMLPGAMVGKIGKAGKAASAISKAGQSSQAAAKGVGIGSGAKNLAIRGLRGYGWYGAGNEIGDIIDNAGFDTAADIARSTGIALGAKSALSPIGSKLPLNKRFMYGVPGGFGVQRGVHDVSSQLEKRGIISPETKKKMDVAGDYIGFGAVGAPLWNAGEKLIEKGVEKGVEHFVGGDNEQVPTENEENTNDYNNNLNNGENQQNNGNGGTEDVNLDDLEKLL